MSVSNTFVLRIIWLQLLGLFLDALFYVGGLHAGFCSGTTLLSLLWLYTEESAVLRHPSDTPALLLSPRTDVAVCGLLCFPEALRNSFCPVKTGVGILNGNYIESGDSF